VEPSNAPWRVLESEPQEPQSSAGPSRRDPPWLAIGALLIAIVVGVSALLLATRPAHEVVVDGATGQSDALGQADASDVGPSSAPALIVEVGGAVLEPGVYRLAPGSRILDAVAAAGGFGPRVDAALADRQLNLAAAVKDGDEIHVPARGEVAAGGSDTGAGGGGGTTAATALINVNSATAEELDTLPGIGPATAAKIIAARDEQPFVSVDDLGTRKAVGPATLEKIRALVTVSP